MNPALLIPLAQIIIPEVFKLAGKDKTNKEKREEVRAVGTSSGAKEGETNLVSELAAFAAKAGLDEAQTLVFMGKALPLLQQLLEETKGAERP